MAYSELIKNFEKIRDYMRDFYVYGFRTRTQFSAGSARSYDNERRRIESWLGDSMAFRQDASGKSVFISVDNRTIAHNPLFQAFKAKSFTDRDITLHFYILDVLADGEALSVRAVADRVAGLMAQASAPEGAAAAPAGSVSGRAPAPELPDDSTIRNKLREYVSLGLLRTEKRGRELLYRRADTPWDMARWRMAVEFASEALPLGVIGSFLLDRYAGDADGAADGHILSFKHHYLMGALDSEVLLGLLECRRLGRAARITFRTRRSERIRETEIFPLRICISTQNGRDNLLAYNFRIRRLRMYRLDRIRTVRPLDVVPAEEAQRLEAASARFAPHLWGTSPGPDSGRGLQHVTMDVHVGEHEEFIPARLVRERRGGTVTQVSEHTWRFEADVLDAGEMVPWIRTFTGRIESFSCSSPWVEERVFDDLREMARIYGCADAAGENGSGDGGSPAGWETGPTEGGDGDGLS